MQGIGVGTYDKADVSTVTLTIQENNKIKRDHQYPDTVEEGAVRRHQEKVGQPEKTTTETVQKIVDEINQEAREQK